MKFALFYLFVTADAYRARHGRKATWTTTTDGSAGACADAIGLNLDQTGQSGDLPIAFPLLCTGQATNVQLKAEAFGFLHALLKLEVNGQEKGTMRFLIWPWGYWKTMSVSLGNFDAGVHEVYFSGGNIDLSSVTLEGTGGSCSFVDAPGWDQAATSYNYRGLDAVNRLFGESRDYPELRKKQLYFASETVGTSDTGDISATAVAEATWTWMLSYSQDSRDSNNDPWGNNPDGLWEEVNITPRLNVSLDPVPGRSGQTMTIYEPCNGLSNIAFHHAAVWLSCKRTSFTRDEKASMVTALNMMAPGSFFLHACACGTGGRADTFSIDWLLFQAYQTTLGQSISVAGDALTSTEKDALMYFNRPPILALDVARNMTSLFRGKYDHAFWNVTMRGINIVSFDTSIAGVIAFITYMMGETTLSWVKGPLDSLINTLLGLFSVGDADWFRETYIPAAKKLAQSVHLCSDSTGSVLSKFLMFAVTFVEALVFQEQQLPTPPEIRAILDFLASIGISSDLFDEMEGDWNYYNGFDCASRSDHALWHEKAAHGFSHMFALADLMTGRVKSNSGEC